MPNLLKTNFWSKIAKIMNENKIKLDMLIFKKTNIFTKWTMDSTRENFRKTIWKSVINFSTESLLCLQDTATLVNSSERLICESAQDQK